MVHPDKRKGLVYIYQSDDGLTHFCWKDRTSNVVEDVRLIFNVMSCILRFMCGFLVEKYVD